MNFESLVNQIVLMCIAFNMNIEIRRSLTAKFATFNLADAICRILDRLEINLLFHKNIL